LNFFVLRSGDNTLNPLIGNPGPVGPLACVPEIFSLRKARHQGLFVCEQDY